MACGTRYEGREREEVLDREWTRIGSRMNANALCLRPFRRRFCLQAKRNTASQTAPHPATGSRKLMFQDLTPRVCNGGHNRRGACGASALMAVLGLWHLLIAAIRLVQAFL